MAREGLIGMRSLLWFKPPAERRENLGHGTKAVIQIEEDGG
jgi:hypothetical protein